MKINISKWPLQGIDVGLLKNNLTLVDAQKSWKKISIMAQSFLGQKNGFSSHQVDSMHETAQALQSYEEQRIREDGELLDEINDLSKEVDRYVLESSLFSYEENLLKLTNLLESWGKISKKEPYNKDFFKKVKKNLYQKLSHEMFSLEYPIMEELSDESYYPTFLKVVKEEMKKEKPNFFNEVFSKSQKEWIQSYMEKKSLKVSKSFDVMTKEDKKRGVEIFVDSVNNLTKYAEDIYLGKETFYEFSKDERKKLESLFWEMGITEGFSFFEKQSSKDKAKWIMELVSSMIIG